jgi:hypothetical protein
MNTNGSYVCNCANSSYVKTQATVCVGKLIECDWNINSMNLFQA